MREGLDEPLTVIGLRLSKQLQRSLATTNAIESLLSRTRHVQRHVKRWRGGTMVLRWVAAGVLEAANGFRRVNGCQDMPTLVAALRARDGRSRSSPGRWRTWPRTTGRSPRRYALNGDDPTGGPGAQGDAASAEPPLNFNSRRGNPAGSRGCSIRVFGEGELEIPAHCRHEDA